MIEKTWGTTNYLFFSEEDCSLLEVGMDGSFKYTVTDDNKIINEDNVFSELVYPIQTELSTCFSKKNFTKYEDLLSSKEELEKCIKENIKVDGIEYNEIVISNIILSDNSKVIYDTCKKNESTSTEIATSDKEETTTGTKELITPSNNKSDNKLSGNTIYFVIGAAVVVLIIITLILIKVLKKKNVPVDNNVNVQNPIDMNNNQNNTL